MTAALDWEASAACRGVPTEVFYGSDRLNYSHTIQAKRICRRCPVVTECLLHALSTREPWGIWGGLTPLERAERLGWAPRVRRSVRGLPAKASEYLQTSPAALVDAVCPPRRRRRNGELW
jgi:WhiB family redox-sensing transcriptional regulator